MKFLTDEERKPKNLAKAALYFMACVGILLGGLFACTPAHAHPMPTIFEASYMAGVVAIAAIVFILASAGALAIIMFVAWCGNSVVEWMRWKWK